MMLDRNQRQGSTKIILAVLGQAESYSLYQSGILGLNSEREVRFNQDRPLLFASVFGIEFDKPNEEHIGS